MRDEFVNTMLKVGKMDENLVVLVGDISHFALQDYAKACPGRFYNVGILESTIISMAAGLSHSGFHPVVHTIAPFIIERGFEQIKLDFCYQELGGNLISVGSAFDYSGLGCSHFCYDDIALIKSLPRTQVIYPAMPNEFKLLFKKNYNNQLLTYFRLPVTKHDVNIPDQAILSGKAITVKSGKDITLVGAGPQLKTIMDSLPELEQHGIDAEIIYPLVVKPFDYTTVRESIAKTKKYIVLEEHVRFGGIGDEVMRSVADMGSVRSSHIAIDDQFIHGYGSYQDHCKAIGLTKANLINKSIKLCR